MIIPKQFEGIEDLESMLLTSILGTLISLKDNLISFKQAESYWFNDFTLELLEQMNMSKELITVFKKCLELKNYQTLHDCFIENVNFLILSVKELMNRYYTEYDSIDTKHDVLN